VFSIFVAEERGQSAVPSERFLCGRIELKSLKGWKFGLARYHLTAAELLGHLEALDSGGEWKSYGTPLAIGKLRRGDRGTVGSHRQYRGSGPCHSDLDARRIVPGWYLDRNRLAPARHQANPEDHQRIRA